MGAMENTTLLSRLRSSMCKFHLMDGRTEEESLYDGGWRDFPHKKFVSGITLNDRFISTHLMGEPLSSIAGFAVHWVGQLNLTTSLCGDVFREIMMVKKDGKANVYRLDLKTLEWHDYKEDLLNPKSPHLVDYNLEIHGIKL